MSHFIIKDKEIHPLIKILGVGFHSILNAINPDSIRISENELNYLFDLQNSLILYLSNEESKLDDRSMLHNVQQSNP
jgi:hypothetical protein